MRFVVVVVVIAAALLWCVVLAAPSSADKAPSHSSGGTDADVQSRIKREWKRAVTYHQHDEPHLAIDTYRSITQFAPHVTQAYTNAAALLIHEGREDEAIELLRAAITQNPADYMANLNLAIVLSEKVENHSLLEEALLCARRATTARPNSQAAFHVLGNIYHSLSVDHLSQSALRTATNIQREQRHPVLPKPFANTFTGTLDVEDITFSSTCVLEHHGKSHLHSSALPAHFKDRALLARQGPIPTRGTRATDAAAAADERGETHRSLPLNEDGSAPVRTLAYHVVSTHPLIVHIPKFLSANECHTIIDSAQAARLHRSSTTSPTSSAVDGTAMPDQAQPSTPVLRESESTWLRGEISQVALQKLMPFLKHFSANKTLDESGIEVEPLQAVHYAAGGFYHAHHDSTPWHPRDVTALYYLSDTNGGKTIFPNSCNGSTSPAHEAQPLADDNTVCLTRSVEELDALDVDELCNSNAAPAVVRKGDALLFFNTLATGAPDPRATHIACPVERNDKWLANHWITGI